MWVLCCGAQLTCSCWYSSSTLWLADFWLRGEFTKDGLRPSIAWIAQLLQPISAPTQRQLLNSASLQSCIWLAAVFSGHHGCWSVSLRLQIHWSWGSMSDYTILFSLWLLDVSLECMWPRPDITNHNNIVGGEVLAIFSCRIGEKVFLFETIILPCQNKSLKMLSQRFSIGHCEKYCKWHQIYSIIFHIGPSLLCTRNYLM